MVACVLASQTASRWDSLSIPFNEMNLIPYDVALPKMRVSTTMPFLEYKAAHGPAVVRKSFIGCSNRDGATLGSI
jgi:hypothetical protein